MPGLNNSQPQVQRRITVTITTCDDCPYKEYGLRKCECADRWFDEGEYFEPENEIAPWCPRISHNNPVSAPVLPTTCDASKWTHEETMNLLQCTYDKGFAEGATKARADTLSLLEEWDYHNNRNFLKPHPVFADMIRMVREKPEDVGKHLKTLRQERS